MDEPRDEQQVEDLAVPEIEQEDVKGGTAVWYLRNSNTPGAANEGAEPHLNTWAGKGSPGGA